MSELQHALDWIVLAGAPGLNVVNIRAALELLGSPGAIVRASEAAGKYAGLPPLAQAFIGSAAAAPGAAERRWLADDRHQLVSFTDPRYPALLAGYADCPIVLYVSGNLAALDDPQIAMVGSRNPTAQGRETAAQIGEYFALRGIAVTSGLADGIDAAAHRGALRARGITIAVLGTGIDVVYPGCNASLYAEIDALGALVSEFPLGTPPRRGNFPRRNRIIAAMSMGTLVVEAALRSGSLLTAKIAKAAGRGVFAVPGSIHNPLSRGCHELIKSGAKLAETGDDILRELNFPAFFSLTRVPVAADPAGAPNEAGMDKDPKILLDALGFDPVDLDTLVVRTGFKAEAVSSMMLILELEGHVQAAPGGRYSRVAHRRAGGER